MNLLSLKYLFTVGLITGAIIIIYQFLDLLLIYHYFKFEYYITGAVIIALITGIILTRRYYKEKLPDANEHNPLDNLTAKELRVLELIATGKSNKEIASLNYTEISTVKTHINNIFFKLRVNNRKDAAKVYVRQHNLQKSTFSPPFII
jgi:DNA-binding CsgD family transcriptional regulator